MVDRRQPHHARQPAPVGPGRLPTGAVALFDLDRTLVPGSSLVALGRAMLRAGLCSRRTLVAGLARDVAYRRRGADDGTAEGVRERALRNVAGLRRDDVLALVDEVGEDLADGVLPAARWLVGRHLDAGDFVVVLSASPQELVDAVARRLGAHRAVGTRAAVLDGRSTGALDGPFCYGPGKLARLRDDVGPVDLGEATAYADSISDLPVLEACADPVAVNPDRALRAVAAERGWPVLGLS